MHYSGSACRECRSNDGAALRISSQTELTDLRFNSLSSHAPVGLSPILPKRDLPHVGSVWRSYDRDSELTLLMLDSRLGDWHKTPFAVM
jgi:hypothetical protein